MGRVDADVLVDVEELIENDLEGVLDILAERAGHPLLQGIEYELVGIQNGAIKLRVSGFIDPDVPPF